MKCHCSSACPASEGVEGSTSDSCPHPKGQLRRFLRGDAASCDTSARLPACSACSARTAAASWGFARQLCGGQTPKKAFCGRLGINGTSTEPEPLPLWGRSTVLSPLGSCCWSSRGAQPGAAGSLCLQPQHLGLAVAGAGARGLCRSCPPLVGTTLWFYGAEVACGLCIPLPCRQQRPRVPSAVAAGSAPPSCCREGRDESWHSTGIAAGVSRAGNYFWEKDAVFRLKR